MHLKYGAHRCLSNLWNSGQGPLFVMVCYDGVMKICTKCLRNRKLTQFRNDRSKPDSLTSWCKDCLDAANSRWKTAHPDQVAQHQATSRMRRAEKIAENTRKWRAENPEAYAAHRAVAEALRVGDLNVRPCETCLKEDMSNLVAHHDSYLPEDRLNVRWLCKKHHAAHHREDG